MHLLTSMYLRMMQIQDSSEHRPLSRSHYWSHACYSLNRGGGVLDGVYLNLHRQGAGIPGMQARVPCPFQQLSMSPSRPFVLSCLQANLLRANSKIEENSRRRDWFVQDSEVVMSHVPDLILIDTSRKITS